MNIVPQDKLKNIAPLYSGWDEVVILSCLQGHTGQAWADNADAPTVARIESLGFCFVSGNADSPQARELLHQIPVGLELQFNSKTWHKLVKEEMDDRTYKFTRYKFKRDSSLFDKEKLRSYTQALPEGYVLAPIDEVMFKHLPTFDWADCHCAQFSSYEEFQEHGLGFVVLFNNEPICAASPYTYCNGIIDVQIDTAEHHRQKGIATACAARLILKCLDRGIFPSWNADCDESRHLAEKLGYQIEKECKCYEMLVKKKEVLFLLLNNWADWEAGHAMAGIGFSEQYIPKTISIDKQPKVSIGSIRAEIDYTVDEYQNFDNLAMIVLVGSFSWRKNHYDEIAELVKKANNTDIPVAAICGATVFLAKHGFLNDVKHTSNSLEFFKERLANEEAYKGWEHFSLAQAINDGGFITANETAALEFAREIMLTLETDSADEINAWYKKHKHGLAKA